MEDSCDAELAGASEGGRQGHLITSIRIENIFIRNILDSKIWFGANILKQVRTSEAGGWYLIKKSL